MSAASQLDAYWREGTAWDLDRWEQLRRRERRAWLAAAGGWVCALAGSVALALLVPLKQVAPFVVRVDNTTGIVDVVPVGVGRVPIPEVVTRYLLTHYVTICERFNLATAESDYEECGAFHSAQRNQLWYARWNPSNASSPLNLYKDGTTISASVVSVSFFRRANGMSDLAQIRYVRRMRRAGGVQEELTHWIATVQYVYAEPAHDPRLRSWNPLGFKIVDFRPEAEVLPENDTGAPARASEAGGR